MRRQLPLAALTGAAFVTRFVHLSASPEPTGWDGYAYVIQLERLAREGHLHWPDSSWVLWFFAALHLVIPSAIVTVKFGACLLAALVVPVAWRAGGPLLALWAACSPTLTHLAGDFPKNLGAVAPLLLLLSPSPPGERVGVRGRLAAAALALVAHRTGAALVLAAGIGALTSKTSPKKLALAILALVAFLAASTLLPGLLHPADLSRVSTQLDLTLHVPPPLPYFALRDTAWPQRVELLLAWPALLVGARRFVRQPEARLHTATFLFPLALCVFPLWKTDVLDLGYRLTLMSPLFAMPLLFDTRKTELRPAWLLALPLLLVSVTGFDPHATPPYTEWRALIARIPRPLPKLLIARQGLNFLYDHETGSEAMAWAPEPALDRREVYRLAFDITDGEWAELAGDDAPQPLRLGPHVVLVREDVWEHFRVRALALDDDDLRARVTSPANPSQVRPASLMHGR